MPKHGAAGFGEPISTLHKQIGAFGCNPSTNFIVVLQCLNKFIEF
jgi:hypothetical protein